MMVGLFLSNLVLHHINYEGEGLNRQVRQVRQERVKEEKFIG
jgi:hypothetical protein